MNRSDTITRLRAADPAAGRGPAVDSSLVRARVEAIQASAGLDPLVPPDARTSPLRRAPRRARFRRAAVLSVAALALPAAALAGSTLLGPADVERGLPDGAKLLNGTDPTCTEVEAGAVYDCVLKTPPPDVPGGLGEEVSWLNAVSLMADREERVNGGCVAQTADGQRWRCYIGRAAQKEWILDARLLGMPINDRCVDPVAKARDAGSSVPRPAPAVNPDEGLAPGEGPTAEQSSHGIILCAMRGTFASAVVVTNLPRASARPRTR